jgi:hypothetical protein
LIERRASLRCQPLVPAPADAELAHGDIAIAPSRRPLGNLGIGEVDGRQAHAPRDERTGCPAMDRQRADLTGRAANAEDA